MFDGRSSSIQPFTHRFENRMAGRRGSNRSVAVSSRPVSSKSERSSDRRRPACSTPRLTPSTTITTIGVDHFQARDRLTPRVQLYPARRRRNESLSPNSPQDEEASNDRDDRDDDSPNGLHWLVLAVVLRKADVAHELGPYGRSFHATGLPGSEPRDPSALSGHAEPNDSNLSTIRCERSLPRAVWSYPDCPPTRSRVGDSRVLQFRRHEPRRAKRLRCGVWSSR